MTLGPEARTLVDAGKQASRPTVADRERVTEALRARIDPGLVSPPGAAPAAALASKGALPVMSAVVVGLAMLGGLAFYSTRDSAGPATHSVPVTPSALPVLEAMSAAPVLPEVLPPVAEVPASKPVAAADKPSAADKSGASDKRPTAPEARGTSDKLAEEVSILSRAEKDFHAGRLASALKLLDEHRRKFPRGTLSQERVALRVHVLCGLGRVSEADAELGVLTRQSPGSLHEGRARAACGPGSK